MKRGSLYTDQLCLAFLQNVSPMQSKGKMYMAQPVIRNLSWRQIYGFKFMNAIWLHLWTVNMWVNAKNKIVNNLFFKKYIIIILFHWLLQKLFSKWFRVFPKLKFIIYCTKQSNFKMLNYVTLTSYSTQCVNNSFGICFCQER